MASIWDQLAQEIAHSIQRRIPPANTHRIRKALRDLHALALGQSASEYQPQEGSTMSQPTDLVSISQSVLDGIANAIESAVSALKTQLASGTLPPAAVTALNTAVTDLEALEVPSTPPVDPTPPVDTPPAS